MTGPKLLTAFLDAKAVSRNDCAERLRVSRTALYYWLTGETAPGQAAREEIATWTDGEVPAESWGPPTDHRKKRDAGAEPDPEV